MASGIYTAMTGARAQEQRLETLNNNLANMMTPGYKRHRATFQAIHNEVHNKLGSPEQAMDVHHPVRFLPEDNVPVLKDERFTVWESGPLRSSGNKLDVALAGNGFFVLEGPNGQPNRYTRNGNFTLSADGTLVSGDGLPVLDPDGQQIQLGGLEGDITIEPGGFIQVGENQVGQIGVVDFENLRLLERVGDSQFVPPAPPPPEVDANGDPIPVANPNVPLPVENPDIRQGWLEGANVNPVTGLALLIKTQRTYDMNVRAIQAYKHMDDLATREVGRAS
jgi:flagellar basal-body rod protein FlgG